MSVNVPSWVPPLVASGGVGAGAGYLIGYATKKFLKVFLKIVAVVIGLVMVAVFAVISWLESNGVLTITFTFNQDKLDALLESTLTWGAGQVGNFVTTLNAAANASVGTLGLAGGMLLGFKKG